MENSTESAQLLLERGADIEAKHTNNLTPFHYVAGKKNTESAQLLLDRGADIEGKDISNPTRLH